MSPAKSKSQLSGKASMEDVDVDVDELGVLERMEEKKAKLEDRIERKKRKLEEKIEKLAEKKRRRPEKKIIRSRKGRPEGYRAQALSTFHREALAPAQRRETQVEATIHHYPVVRTSMELLKVVLHTMISSILFTRELLPQESFGIRNLPTCFADETFCFEEHFMNGGIVPVESYPVQLRHGQIMVLERNKGRLTNSIISCLETIFAKFLLQRKLLGLQFLVCRDKKHPMEVYETYTISIDYSGKRGPSDREGTKLDFHDRKKDLKYSMKIQKAILAIFRRIFIEIGIGTLPNNRSLAVRVFQTPFASDPMYDDDFRRSWSEQISFPEIPGWRRQTVHSEFIDTGFYGASLSVTFLDPPTTVETMSGKHTPLPAQVHFPDHRNRGADVNWEHGVVWVKKEIAKRPAAKKAARDAALKKAKNAG